jgi:trigger factor
MVPVTRPVQLGDLVTINMKGGIEGREATDREGVQIAVTNERPIFPWLEQLVGLNANDTREITNVYGDEAPAELQGKSATYTVTVTDVKEPKLPELNDEFAKSISVLETMEQLRSRIRTNQYQEKVANEENRFADEVLDAIIEQSQIHFPASMLDDEVELEIKRSQDLAVRLGLTWEKYLDLSGRDEAAYRTDAKPTAGIRLKRLLAMMQLAEAESIQVTSKEIDVEIDQRAQAAQMQGGDAAQTRRALSNKESRQNIEFTLRLRKAMDRVVAMVKGEPTSGKIITPEMLRDEMRQRETEQAQRQAPTGVAPSGLITDPSQVSGNNMPGQLGKILLPGQE